VEDNDMHKSSMLALYLTLTACAGHHDLPNAERLENRGKPAAFLANTDLHDGKTVYVSGYVWASSEWWTDHVRQSPNDFTKCLNIGPSHFLELRRRNLEGEWMTLKGVFKKGAWAGSLAGCRTEDGLILDDAYMEKRYRGLIREKKW